MAFDVILDNRTPFEAETHVQIDADGQELLVVMLSASFSAGKAGMLELSEQQQPVIMGDEPFGDPSLSSTRYEADIAPVKPACEVIVNGSAYAPCGKPVREMQVGLKIGEVRKVLAVTGDRFRDITSFGPPQPFTTMPIVYERAFGGTLEDGRVDMRNPVGVGYRGAASADPAVHTQAPNISYAGDPNRSPSDSPRPAGFGSIGRGWEPRLRFAGTCDKAWLENQWPLPPKDFDTRSYLCAPEDQRLSRIGGGEDVSLIGLTPDGRWDFRLPKIIVPVRLIHDDHISEHVFSPDTVVIEPDLMRVTLKARFSVTTRRNVPRLREIIFGHVSPALLIARRKRKEYLNLSGGDGTIGDRPTWLP